MRPCWAAFAVHSLEIARSAAAPRPLCLLAPHESQLPRLRTRTLKPSYRGLGMHYCTSGPAMMALEPSFFSQAVIGPQLSAQLRAPEITRRFFVIYIGDLH